LKKIVAFTGLVREKDHFFDELKYFNSLKEEKIIDELVFCTWKGELSDNAKEELSEFIDHFVLPEPLDDGWHQSIIPNWLELKSLGWKNLVGFNLNPADNTMRQIMLHSAVLDYAGDDALVMRTRADIKHNRKFFRKALSEGLKKSNGPLFDYKIWIQAYEVFHPWELKDWAWFGYSKDLKKLVHKNEVIFNNLRHYDLSTGCALKFISPFLKKSKNLKILNGEECPFHIVGGEGKSWLTQYYCIGPAKAWWSDISYKFMANSLSWEVYLDSLAEYYADIWMYFDVGIGKEVTDEHIDSFAYALARRKSGELKWVVPVGKESQQQSDKFVETYPGLRLPSVLSNLFAENMVEGKMQDDRHPYANHISERCKFYLTKNEDS
tara:strand:- start:1348 stop:2487 length:1140 start_codon:yes stop_codon:yes gene_type:complete